MDKLALLISTIATISLAIFFTVIIEHESFELGLITGLFASFIGFLMIVLVELIPK